MPLLRATRRHDAERTNVRKCMPWGVPCRQHAALQVGQLLSEASMSRGREAQGMNFLHSLLPVGWGMEPACRRLLCGVHGLRWPKVPKDLPRK